MSTFENFSLSEPLLRALKGMHHHQPTPIQTGAIPVIMEGKDLIGIAQTGTGKTAAFGIPIVNALIKDPKLNAVVLVPTRELATQIEKVFRELTFHVRREISTTILIGGVSIHAQIRALRARPRIVIATPGRLLDHVNQRTLTLADYRIVVLDEADRMLDIGFEPQIRKAFQFLPKVRQTLLFSATFPKEIEKLAARYLSSPQRVTIGKIAEPIKNIQQSIVNTTAHEKNAALMKELNQREGSVLIFARTRHRTDRLARFLNNEGFKADRIHGDRTQGQRVRAMDAFRDQKVRILVATDIASRGIDIPHIAHVVNYDLPQVAEDYVHRIGRTARAGAEGKSLCFITPEDRGKWAEISRHLSRTA